jgi:hypothetical protein
MELPRGRLTARRTPRTQRVRAGSRGVRAGSEVAERAAWKVEWGFWCIIRALRV